MKEYIFKKVKINFHSAQTILMNLEDLNAYVFRNFVVRDESLDTFDILNIFFAQNLLECTML